jgi:hypothetical protein
MSENICRDRRLGDLLAAAAAPARRRRGELLANRLSAFHCRGTTSRVSVMSVINLARPSLLAMTLYAKYGHHQPLDRQSESFAREGTIVGTKPRRV